ncbi:MAG: hypothetical protein IJX63_09640 [Lachnospiraceae bacterium]|nr:hypothetical protein [Lachnospiraceae bacterium]
MKSLKKATIIVAGICILYWIVGAMLSFTPLLYRSLVEAIGKMLTIEVLPTLLLLLAGKWFYKVLDGKTGLKVVLGIIVVWVYVHWMFLSFLIILSNTQEEVYLTRHLLETDETTYTKGGCYRYYQPIAFFFKRPTMLTEALQIEYLEKKYDRTFIALDEHLFFVEENPLVEVVVWDAGMELSDNYVEALWQYYVEEGCEFLGVNRDYYVIEDRRGTPGWVYMELEDEADIGAFAIDACALMQYVAASTNFFEKYERAYLYFYQNDGEDLITGCIPFGQLGKLKYLQKDYYLYPEQVFELLQSEYQKEKEYLVKQRKQDYHWKLEQQLKEQSTPEPVEAETNLEDMAQLIFEEVLSESDVGYLYQVKYNAKGNLYIDLGSRLAGETGDKSSEGYYRFTLVYDRTSKNGACELFVLYKEHYTKEDVNDGCAFLDIYAVEIDTGKVIASDKQAWSEVGTEEYREATGE